MQDRAPPRCLDHLAVVEDHGVAGDQPASVRRRRCAFRGCLWPYVGRIGLCCGTLFAAERLSPSARERVPAPTCQEAHQPARSSLSRWGCWDALLCSASLKGGLAPYRIRHEHRGSRRAASRPARVAPPSELSQGRGFLLRHPPGGSRRSPQSLRGSQPRAPTDERGPHDWPASDPAFRITLTRDPKSPAAPGPAPVRAPGGPRRALHVPRHEPAQLGPRHAPDRDPAGRRLRRRRHDQVRPISDRDDRPEEGPAGPDGPHHDSWARRLGADGRPQQRPGDARLPDLHGRETAPSSRSPA